MNPENIIQQAHDAGTRLVRFLYCDNGGTIRGKATALSGLGGRLSDGIGLTVAMMAMNSLDQLQPVPPEVDQHREDGPELDESVVGVRDLGARTGDGEELGRQDQVRGAADRDELSEPLNES